jgi:peptidoglycan/LPS O-acetylase OafA/YrhL
MSTGPGYKPRYDSLDSWRGVACLMVVVHHSGFYCLSWSETMGSSVEAWARWLIVSLFHWMEMGVPLFFVISGYCIGASMDRHRRRGDSSWGFLARRFRRIYPPYWASVLVFAVTTWTRDRLGLIWLHRSGHSLELDSPGKLDWTQWLGNLTLTETWRQTVWGGSSFEPYTRVSWSLCYEEQFYFVGFLVLLVAPRRLYGALGILTAAIVGFRVFAFDVGWLNNYRGTFIDRWHEFAVGLLVYWRLVAAPSRQAKVLVDLTLLALTVVGLAWSYPETWVAGAFGLLLIALRRFDEQVTGSKWFNPLRACGLRSYSIYLIHLLVCTVGNELLYHYLGISKFWGKVLVMTPIVSIAAVGAGWMFFWAVESRFLHRQQLAVSS